MSAYEEIEERIEAALNAADEEGNQSDFSFRFYGNGENRHNCIFEAFSPDGENIVIELTIDEEDAKMNADDIFNCIVFDVDKHANEYDADEHAELWIEGRGKNGVPNSIREILDDADAIGEMYFDLANRLKRAKNAELHKYEIIIDYQASDRFIVKSFTPEDAINKAMEKHEKTKREVYEYLFPIKAFVNDVDGEPPKADKEYERYY